MTWRLSGVKSLHWTNDGAFWWHICVNRPQWVKWLFPQNIFSGFKFALLGRHGNEAEALVRFFEKFSKIENRKQEIMIRTLHYHLYLNLFFICYRPYYNSLTDTEMWFWRNIRHWLQRKSSLCQLPVHPMTKMSSIWALNVVLCDNVSGCYYWYGIYCWRNDVKTWIKYPIFNFSSSVQRFIQRDFSSDIFAYVCNTLYMDTLIHWGRVTHIRVMKLIIIGSDNGLSPSRRQSIIWTSAGILLIGHWGTNFNEIFIIIQQFWLTHWGRVTHTGKKY